LLGVGEQRGVHRGGPRWPDFDAQSEARHQRAGRPVDEKPVVAEPTERLRGRWWWAGPISIHFGHQIIEFSTRIFPALLHDRSARFLFAVPPSGRFATLDTAPPFVSEVLSWFGADPSQCHVVATPTRVDELAVAPQAEQLGGPGPSPPHLDALDALDALVARRLPDRTRSGTVYVSRAGLTARFAGEAYLEDVLRRCGVTVVRPEELALPRQLETYATTDRLIFAEGSALFASALLGRSLGDTVVLVRRAGRRLARPSLAPRVSTLQYHDAIADFIDGVTFRGEPAPFRGLTTLTEDALLDLFDELGIAARRHWDHASYTQARVDDEERRHAVLQRARNKRAPR
jgi:hypothetical protein